MIYKLDFDQCIKELTSNYVEHLYSNYVPENSLLILDGIDYTNIEIPNYVSHVIFDGATNPVPIDPLLRNIKADNFFICSGFYTYFKNVSNTKIKFFPFWLLWMSQQPYNFSIQSKQFKVSCLNGTNWEHRKLTYLELSKRDYFDQLVLTYKHTPSVPGISELLLSDDEQQQLLSLPQQKSFVDGDLTIGIDLTINHPAYQNTYVNLVTETVTDVNKPMLSEKTFKPITAGQFFVLIAPPGAIEFLRNIGIDTFDDLIDHSYDTITDTRKRILAVIKQVDYLMEQNLEDWYAQNKLRLKRNSDYFKSDEFRKQFLLTF
jgi:hypothetical protein